MHAKGILFLSYAAAMMSTIFIPNYASALGAGRMEIGIIGTSYGVAILLSSYLVGRASDFTGRRIFVISGTALSALAYLLHIPAQSSAALVGVRALAGLGMGALTPPLIARTRETGEPLGTLASFGSLGWATGSLLAGIFATGGESFGELEAYWLVFLVCSLLMLPALALSVRMPELRFSRVRTPLFPVHLVKRNLHIYLPNLLRHTGAFAVWLIFPLYLEVLGASKLWIGVIYSANTFSQFIIMRHLNTGGALLHLRLGLGMSMLVFLTYALVGSYLAVLPVQLFLALSYSMLYVGSLRYLVENNPEAATSVGLLGSFTSISMVLGPLLGGAISHAYGYTATMYFASGITLLALLFHLWWSKRST
ncbi:MAG: MFS transporter [Euryarchaeota archaeon]|nr:MFS transporter [Euryarchaeota archaeon]